MVFMEFFIACHFFMKSSCTFLNFLSRLTLPFLKVYYKYKHISTKKKNKYRYHLQKFEYLWGIARYGEL